MWKQEVCNNYNSYGDGSNGFESGLEIKSWVSPIKWDAEVCGQQ